MARPCTHDYKSAVVYGLCDPATGALRYIGSTAIPLNYRLACHITHRFTRTGPKNLWIRGLVEQGLKPEIFPIEEVPISQAEESEFFWMQYFRSIGCSLFNQRIPDMSEAIRRRASVVKPKPVRAIKAKIAPTEAELAERQAKRLERLQMRREHRQKEREKAEAPTGEIPECVSAGAYLTAMFQTSPNAPRCVFEERVRRFTRLAIEAQTTT